MNKVIILLGAAALTLAVSAQAGSSDPKKASAPSTVAKDDVEFLTEASQTGMTEIQAAQIASTRAKGTDVRDFAGQMAADHGNDGEVLKALATKKGVVLPSQLDGKHQDLIDKLQKEDADEFDATYAKAMTEGHKKALEMYTKASKKSKDVGIRDYAANDVATLKNHLALAQSLGKKK